VSHRRILVRLDAEATGGESGGERSYSILIGPGVVAELGNAMRKEGCGRAVIICDDRVREPHASAAGQSLAAVGITAEIISIPCGESSKSVAEADRLWNALAALAVDRRTHIIAVGGGVAGDLAGFVAATFARGLPFWQVPTTLVAQVDSAIGGKTGINLDAGKNLVGAFWQPRGVFADIDTLATLPDREYRSGLAEVVKYGVILDAEFFVWLERHAGEILLRDPAAVVHLVERSASLKARVVEEDEHELTGLRAILNYGHTFGHAYEAAAGYGRLLHGEAVALGMTTAARLAAALGRIDAGFVARQDALLRSLGLPLTAADLGTTEWMPPADALLAIMGRDKKTIGGNLRFVLPTRIGQVELIDGIDPAIVRRLL